MPHPFRSFSGFIALSSLLFISFSAEAGRVTLSSGDVLEGAIVEQAQGRVVMEHPVLGTLELEGDAIESVTLTPEDPAAARVTPVAEAEGSGPVADAESPAVGDRSWFDVWAEDWTNTIELGITGSEGNTVDFNLRFLFSTTYADDRDRWLFETVYTYETDDRETSENEFIARGEKDWFIPESRWFAFLKSKYEYDQFESWRHRLEASVGPGYQIFNEDDLKLRALVGPSFRKDFAGAEEFTPEVFAGLELLNWQIHPDHALLGSLNYHQGVEDLDEYRALARVEYRMNLAKMNESLDTAYLKVGFELEHESQVEPGDDPNDLDYYLTLGFEF